MSGIVLDILEKMTLDRTVAENEVIAVNELLVELAKLGDHPDKPTVITRPELQKVAWQENSRTIIAKDTDKDPLKEPNIVGMGTIHWSNIFSGINAYIHDVVVLESYAGKGIGRSIMKRLIDFARDAKVKNIYLTSNAKRDNARKLYESLGFKQIDNGYKLTL